MNDDNKQSPLSANFITENAEKGLLYLSPFILMELVWLLKAKGLSRQHIVPILEKLIDTDGVLIGQKNVIVSAVNLYRKHNLSFSDCLIAADGDINANANTAVFFDQAMIKLCPRCVSVT